MTSIIRLGAVLLGVSLLAVGEARAAIRFALSVGNNLGDTEDGALRWAENDAKRVREVLIELAGVSEDRALLLTGAGVTELKERLRRLQAQAEEAKRNGHRTELIFFYSGHGDAEGLHLGGELMTFEELQGALQAIPTDATLTIVDACRAQRLKRGRSKGSSAGPSFDISLARDPGPRGLVLMTSAGDDEVAQESDELGGAFFTHHLLSGLRGAADLDHDGRVTLSEAYRYAYNRTLSGSHGAAAAVQHPELTVDLKGEADWPLTQLHRAGATLILDRDLDGSVLVVDDRLGRVVAELAKGGDREVRLALPTGAYRIQLRRPGEAYAGKVQLGWGGERTLKLAELQRQSLEVALVKGAGLNPQPWSLGLGAAVSNGVLLDESPALGLNVRLNRELTDTWSLVSSLRISHVSADNGVWFSRQEELDAVAGLAARQMVGIVRLSLGVLGGAVAVFEQRERLDAARLEDAGVAGGASSGSALGPVLGIDGVAALALNDDFGLFIAVAGQLSWLEAGQTWRLRSILRGSFGVEMFF